MYETKDKISLIFINNYILAETFPKTEYEKSNKEIAAEAGIYYILC